MWIKIATIELVELHEQHLVTIRALEVQHQEALLRHAVEALHREVLRIETLELEAAEAILDQVVAPAEVLEATEVLVAQAGHHQQLGLLHRLVQADLQALEVAAAEEIKLDLN